MEETLEAFKELLEECEEEEYFAGCVKIIEEDWEDMPEIYKQLVDAAVDVCCKVKKATTRIGVLNVLHEMSNIPEMLDMVAGQIGRLVEGALLSTNSDDIWAMVEKWKQGTNLPSNVLIELNDLKKRGNEKGVPLTFEALRFFGAEESFAQTIEEEWDKVDEQAAGKVVAWLKGVERVLRTGERLPSPVKQLPPTKWVVDTAAVASFMDLLTMRITEALVDAPHLQKLIGDVLAHTTSITGRVEKAKRLQDLASQLSAITNGRITAASFEEFMKPLLPASVLERNPYEDVPKDKDAASSASSEYDPLAIDTPDLHPSAEDMNPDTTHYLPPYTGQASTHLTPPSLGPSHVLCRIWNPSSTEWAKYTHQANRCTPLRVLLVRRKKKGG